MEITSQSQGRFHFLDLAKGLAVIFMIVQHFSVWLWDVHWSKSASLFKENPVYFTMISFSGISAPVFIFAAGCGAWFFMQKYHDIPKVIRRGFLLILFGYLLNFTISSWFTYASWYVLHLIGFGYLIVPILYKSSRRFLPVYVLAVLVASFLIQHLLNTPFSYGNHRMGDTSLTLAPLRLAFVEGHFPVLPWVGMFITGFYTAPLIKNKKFMTILNTGGGLILVGLTLASVSYIYPPIQNIPLLERLLEVRVRFYPLLVPMFFFLLGLTHIVMVILYYVTEKLSLKSSNPLIGIGRISLTAFITHVFVKQFVYTFNFRATFSKIETIALTLLLLIMYALAEKYWKKISYRFGFEWILRKFG